MKKRILSIILISALSISLFVGCGNNNDNNNVQNSNQEQHEQHPEDDKKDDNINPGDSDLDLDDLDEADGMFYLDYMKVVNNKLQIKGYNTINGIDNDLDTDIKYFIMYYNIDTEEYSIDEMNRIENKKEITRPVFGPDDK